ncbi:MAG TPA: MBL fold metallo-hydrolase [Stellaceae bacterium]|nr:MBL fold metallo-hydrolase [Stellaceae bacterium]
MSTLSFRRLAAELGIEPPERFANPPGSPVRTRRHTRVLKFLWRQRIHASLPRIPDGHHLPLDAALAGLDAHHRGDGEAVTWLGHAAFLLRMAGQNVLVDPFLSDYASPIAGVGPRRFTPPGLPVGHLPRIDVLLVSHNHYDHLDARTIEALTGKRRIRVIVPLGLGRFFGTRGFRRITELAWHEAAEIGGLRVTCVPAIHRSARSLTDRNRTLWGGFVLESASRRVYFGGDTAYGSIFKETGRRHGPFDLALIGIGCYAPRAAMHMNHADPEEAVQIARDLGAAHVMGMHWGTLRMTEEPPFEPPRRFRIAAAAAGYAPYQAWLMPVGETRALPEGVMKRLSEAA